LRRTDSTGSFISIAVSTRAPSPAVEKESFLGNRSISDFHIEGEIGRGAYGLVKRGRDIHPDGSLGVSSLAWFSLAMVERFGVASSGHQTNHQVPHTGRLLEEASRTWDDTDRNLRYVRYL
jgi:hypothetical protein